jgi:site-specific DNA-methyltransferase (adenine-specific)
LEGWYYGFQTGRGLAKHESVLVFCKGSPQYNPQMTPGKPYTRTRRANGYTNNCFAGMDKQDVVSVYEGERYPTSVIAIPQQWRQQDQVHSAQKPVALMEYMIRTYTQPGETVLDNAFGSATTGIACANTGRRFVGIERDARYFNIGTRSHPPERQL